MMTQWAASPINAKFRKLENHCHSQSTLCFLHKLQTAYYLSEKYEKILFSWRQLQPNFLDNIPGDTKPAICHLCASWALLAAELDKPFFLTLLKTPLGKRML